MLSLSTIDIGRHILHPPKYIVNQCHSYHSCIVTSIIIVIIIVIIITSIFIVIIIIILLFFHYQLR